MSKRSISCEQQARNILTEMGIEDAQLMSAGDLVLLANLINDLTSNKIMLKQAIELEREECAKIADELASMLVHTKQEWTPLGIIEECAYMIRERGVL